MTNSIIEFRRYLKRRNYSKHTIRNYLHSIKQFVLWVDVPYLQQRSSSRVNKVFLVEKGTYKGKPISVRGIQKRIEYYARKSGVQVSCHRLRHTMATQMLNADAKMVTIQDLLGHARIATTERYSKVSNLTVHRDYHKTMDIITTGRSGEAIAGGYKKFFTKEKQRIVSRHVTESVHDDHL